MRITGAHYKPKFGPETGIPLAYFDETGKRLFVNIPTMQYLYIQELLPQPAWLNSMEGVMKMVQACLGDFSKLLDPLFINEGILDPCLQCIIQNGSLKAGLVSASQTTCGTCEEFITVIKKGLELAKQQSDAPPPFSAPSIPGQDDAPSVPNGSTP